MNEKGIYWKSLIVGIVITAVSLIIEITPIHRFDFGILLYSIPCLIAIIYAGLQGLLPGLTSFLMWVTGFALILFIKSGLYEVSRMLSAFLLTGACCVAAGLVTTLTRKRVIATLLGFAVFCVVLVI